MSLPQTRRIMLPVLVAFSDEEADVVDRIAPVGDRLQQRRDLAAIGELREPATSWLMHREVE